MYPKHYFDLFREDIVTGTVFVGMDFGARFLSRRTDIIEAGVAEAGFRPVTVDTSHFNESILMDILKGVQTSQLLLFEVSQISGKFRNGNVLYELGLAHANRLPEEVLVLREDDGQLLFDIATFRVRKYNPHDISGSKRMVSELLKELAGNVDRTKAMIVEKVISQLDDYCIVLMYQLLGQTHFSISPATPHPVQVDQRTAIRRLLELGVLRTGHNFARGSMRITGQL